MQGTGESPHTFPLATTTVYNPKKEDVGDTYFLYRVHGVAVVFDVTRVGPEGPQAWITLIRGAHPDMPIVCCGVIGLFSDKRIAEEADYQAMCDRAGVEYFSIDCRIEDSEGKRALETLTGKAAIKAIYAYEQGESK